MLRSLNPLWHLEGFHLRIAALAGIRDGDRVLDMGCGNGNGLSAMVSAAGPNGRVVAVDRDLPSLGRIAERFARDMDEQRLATLQANIAEPLPLNGATFDVVICQNVIECVRDRPGLLREIHRLLRPGGMALVGHHDFDGVLLASDDRELTRKLVHGYADSRQPWQDVSEGQMGRLLPGLFADDLFVEATTETILFADLSLAAGTYARQHLGDIVALCAHYDVATNVAEAWLRRLEARSAAGTFYYALPWTCVVARRAPEQV